MQITEASPAVRSSLRLLLNSLVASEKNVSCANLDAQNLCVLGKDVPNFKGCEKKEVWSYAQLCLQKRWLCSFGFLSRELDVWSVCIHSPLELGRQNAHIGFSSLFLYILLSHHISFHILHFSPEHLLITSCARFSLLPGFIFPDTKT